jgi:hypothetical protein
MNNLEPVNSRKDYLSPRAKIGDVVIVKNGGEPIQVRIVNARLRSLQWNYYFKRKESEDVELIIFEDDIIKNLTTNISYE